MIETDPVTCPSVYDVRGYGRPSPGPSGLGPAPRPLPFTTIRVSPSATTAVGYHSVGMRPASLSSPFAAATPERLAERSNTATAFASPSAANRRVPSAERASALGVEPSPGP